MDEEMEIAADYKGRWKGAAELKGNIKKKKGTWICSKNIRWSGWRINRRRKFWFWLFWRCRRFLNFNLKMQHYRKIKTL